MAPKPKALVDISATASCVIRLDHDLVLVNGKPHDMVRAADATFPGLTKSSRNDVHNQYNEIVEPATLHALWYVIGAGRRSTRLLCPNERQSKSKLAQSEPIRL